jgi:hypothetical protein
VTVSISIVFIVSLVGLLKSFENVAQPDFWNHCFRESPRLSAENFHNNKLNSNNALISSNFSILRDGFQKIRSVSGRRRDSEPISTQQRHLSGF